MMVKLAENGPVSSLFSIEPFCDSGDGSRAEAGSFFDDGVGDLIGEHFCYPESVAEFGNLLFCHQIAQKTFSLGCRFER